MSAEHALIELQATVDYLNRKLALEKDEIIRESIIKELTEAKENLNKKQILLG